jgi:hypothetical protein
MKSGYDARFSKRRYGKDPEVFLRLMRHPGTPERAGRSGTGGFNSGQQQGSE